MDEAEKLSLEAIGRFVEASEEIRFEGENRHQVYGWAEQVLVQQEYAQQGKAARGLGAALHGEDDGAKPGGPRGRTGAVDRSLHGQRAGPGTGGSFLGRSRITEGLRRGGEGQLFDRETPDSLLSPSDDLLNRNWYILASSSGPIGAIQRLALDVHAAH